MTASDAATDLVLRSYVASLLMDLAEAVDHARGDEDGAAAVSVLRGDLERLSRYVREVVRWDELRTVVRIRAEVADAAEEVAK